MCRATDRGDTGANRIRTVLTQTLAAGTTATLRAKVRWLKGHPEILLRLHGNWLEAAGDILTTRNLGTPGPATPQAAPTPARPSPTSATRPSCPPPARR